MNALTDLIIAGAGMAGLAAAARARELGATVIAREKGDSAGGAMHLPSRAFRRYRSFARFRSECPTGAGYAGGLAPAFVRGRVAVESALEGR